MCGIWKTRNALIFDNISQNSTVVGLNFLRFYKEFLKPRCLQKPVIKEGLPHGYFDGASNKDILSIQVFGDSKVIVDWAAGFSSLHVSILDLEQWCFRTRKMMDCFNLSHKIRRI